MNRPRWHKVLFDLWSNRSRSALVVASILVGLFAIGVIANLYVLIDEDMRTGYQKTNPANIFINTSLYDKAFLDHVRRLEDVRQAQGLRSATLRLKTGPDQWVAFQLIALPDYQDIQINQVQPFEGVWPPGEKQVVLERSKLSRANARLGDLLTIETSPTSTRQLRFVGVVDDQSQGAGGSGVGGFFTANVRGYVTQDTLDWLEQSLPTKLNTILITLDGSQDRTAMEQTANRITDDLKKNGFTVYSSSVRSSLDHPNRDLLQAIVGVLFALGMMVVFLSGFLITNTLQALLEQQVQQVGIMKSIGARRWQVVNVYTVMILIYGILAFLLSVPLAAQVANGLLGFLSTSLNFATLGQHLVPGVILLQFALALIIPQAAAFLPIWKGTGISVQEALSGVREAGQQSQGWLDERLANLRSFSRPIRISIRNVIRRKGRLVLTLITLTAGGAIFIGTFGVKISMQKYMDQIGRYFLADVNITLARPYRVEEIQQILQTLPGIRYMEPWGGARSQILLPDNSIGEDVQMLAPPANSPLVKPVMIQGRWIQPGDQNAIVLNELFLSRYPDLQVGDTLRLQVNDKKTEWHIVGFFRFAGKVTGFMAYADYDYLSQLTGQTKQANLYRIVINDGPAGSASPAEQTAMAQLIEARLRENNISIGEVTTGTRLVELSGGGFGILTSFLLFLASLIALVGSIGLAGTMSMNVMERTREIGILRAIGATNRTLMKMVIVEGTLIGLISFLLACILSFPVGKLISDSITESVFGAPSQLGYTINGFLIWLAIVIALSVLASVMPARSAASLTIREVLSYE